PASQCNTGDLQCCDTVTTADSAAASKIIALLGIVVQDVTAAVGLTCSPISVIGVAGNSCSAQPVCCTDNSFHGLISLGCTPVDLNL
ncbi:hydrophobin, partial [Crassisporium funariophilum]